MWFLSDALRDRFFVTAGLHRSLVTAHVGSMPIERPSPLPETRAALRRRLGVEGFTLLCLGRLVPVKGVDQLLRAVASLPEPISIRIAGDGPERRKLQSLAQQLAVDATFEGWVTGERREALLHACDAIVVPSRPQDGLPTVLFEAKARALPIIATEAGAIPEHLRTHAGAILVPPNDGAALGQAIRQLRAQRAAGQTLRA